jgi:hypothetical protein
MKTLNLSDEDYEALVSALSDVATVDAEEADRLYDLLKPIDYEEQRDESEA